MEAAPTGCAGAITAHTLRRTQAVPGDRVAILAVGGLGHLGIQSARSMGFETVTINRASANAENVKEAMQFEQSTRVRASVEVLRLSKARP